MTTRLTLHQIGGVGFAAGVIPVVVNARMSSFFEAPRPHRRVTLTPLARLSALAQLLDFICGFRCAVHNHRAGVHQVLNGRITYAACCEDVLDAIQSALEGRTENA